MTPRLAVTAGRPRHIPHRPKFELAEEYPNPDTFLRMYLAAAGPIVSLSGRGNAQAKGPNQIRRPLSAPTRRVTTVRRTVSARARRVSVCYLTYPVERSVSDTGSRRNASR